MRHDLRLALRALAHPGRDGAGSVPVATVSAGLAAAAWPGRGAIGQRLRAGHLQRLPVHRATAGSTMTPPRRNPPPAVP